jgi:hypothetical protein
MSTNKKSRTTKAIINSVQHSINNKLVTHLVLVHFVFTIDIFDERRD